MHDPLAICAALEPGLVDFVEVENMAETGGFGAVRRDGTGQCNTVWYDHVRFLLRFLN